MCVFAGEHISVEMIQATEDYDGQKHTHTHTHQHTQSSTPLTKQGAGFSPGLRPLQTNSCSPRPPRPQATFEPSPSTNLADTRQAKSVFSVLFYLLFFVTAQSPTHTHHLHLHHQTHCPHTVPNFVAVETTRGGNSLLCRNLCQH